MTQTKILSRAALLSLISVSVVFFIFTLLKAPLVGVIKISVATFAIFKTALVVTMGVLWLFFNYLDENRRYFR